jgi:hypothetical protein
MMMVTRTKYVDCHGWKCIYTIVFRWVYISDFEVMIISMPIFSKKKKKKCDETKKFKR